MTIERLTPEDQLGTLSMCRGEETLEALQFLPYSSESERTDLKATLKVLEEHYTGEVNVTFERFQFFTVINKRMSHSLSI